VVSAGKATFGGPKTLVVTTNTAGRAAVTTLTPTGSGALQMTTAATSGPCTFDQQHSGTIQMVITVQESGTVSGTAVVDGTGTITRVGATCVGPVLNFTETYRCCNPNPAPSVTGTAQSLAFTGSHPGAPGVTWTYKFQGSLSGSQVTGTLSLTIASSAAAGDANFPATLTKQ